MICNYFVTISVILSFLNAVNLALAQKDIKRSLAYFAKFLYMSKLRH